MTSTTALQHLVRFGNGSDCKSIEAPEGPYPVYGSGGEFARATEYLHEGESVLFGRKGTVDRPLYVNGRFWTVDTMYYTVPGPQVEPKFLYYWATTIPFDLYSTNTALPSMTSGMLGRLQFPLLERKNQRRIADYLDRETATIDALIEKQQRLRSVLKERRQEVVRAHLADVGPQVQLRHLVVRERPMTYGILQAGEHDDGGVPYIGPADISRVGGTPALQDLRRTTVEIAAQYRRSTLRPGDLVASIGPAYGHVMEVSEELDGANLTQDTVRLALDPDRANRRYLMWVLQGAASRDFWDFEITGATFRRLNLGTLARTPVPLPSLNEQREIADHLDRATAKIDALIAKAERFIELAQERRAALITAAVTGQIEIPTED
ncbi:MULTISPECIES: restriction endonuclease subunit S [Micrococcus]|uniref:Type I restriction enzyme S subunit n=1 Tax=Micrococcus yunnanensis TaxID=566027 RepID=A0ABR6D2U9_9MICC|nr:MULTISPECIES: restriction endonuclease subunit S [Micrococcus]MBA9059997.1 type I restriction enzyme S subunit [Micrococcus yunnanensis]MCV7542863.1 restriction endonuclease subunit S [Micrococcus luteus]MCV7618410.1 restriction endonuclease subunit S [Micrococcus luteus]MDK8177049.1 restriction endonuclease subunit S [Micrococcus luteus]